MITFESLGATGYGGAVQLATWWDNKRIDEGRLTAKDVFQKASTWTYLGVGLVATLSNIFGWLRNWERWLTPMAHGFLYDLPRFAIDLNRSLGKASTASSTAVLEAQRIVKMRQLAAGSPDVARNVSRTYQPEFNRSGSL